MIFQYLEKMNIIAIPQRKFDIIFISKLRTLVKDRYKSEINNLSDALFMYKIRSMTNDNNLVGVKNEHLFAVKDIKPFLREYKYIKSDATGLDITKFFKDNMTEIDTLISNKSGGNEGQTLPFLDENNKVIEKTVYRVICNGILYDTKDDLQSAKRCFQIVNAYLEGYLTLDILSKSKDLSPQCIDLCKLAIPFSR